MSWGIWTEPERTTVALSGGDAVIVVVATTYGEDYPARPNVNFPRAESVRLPEDPSLETEWEGQGDSGIARASSRSLVDGWMVEVHVFFGSDDPSPQVLDA